MRRARLAVGFVLLAACSASEHGSFTPSESELLATPSAVVVALPDGRVIAESEGRLIAIDPRRLDAEAAVIGPAADVGEVHAAVPIGGAVLILASGGTFVVRDSAWVPSPLGAALDGPVRGAVALAPSAGADLGDVWIATDRSLYRVVGEAVERFDLEGVEGARLAAVQRADGPALWVLLGDRLLEVWRDRTGTVRSARLVLPSVPTAIAGDAAGVGWLAMDESLWSIGADRRLVDHALSVERLLGSALSQDVWAFASDGDVWLHTRDGLFAADAAIAPAERLALGPDGSLFAAGTTLRRLAPRRDVLVDGAADGTLLVTPQTFTIVLEGAPQIEATIDAMPVEVAAQPFRVELVPAELGDGEHELVVRIAYDDGTLPTEIRRTFQVVTHATWTEHVEPLYVEHCSACHGAAGPALTRLDDPTGWMGRSDQILVNLIEGRMPLNRPPLTQREIALIQAWIASGYPE